MKKQIFALLTIFFIFIIYIDTPAQQNNSPTIYKIQESSFGLGGVSVISVIDALTQNTTTSFPIPLSGDKIELSSDGKKGFINAMLGSNSSSVPGLVALDLKDGTLKGAFNGEGVYRAKVSPDNTLWALLGNENKVVLLNPDNLTPIATINNIQMPTDIVFSPDGNRAYISETALASSGNFVNIGVFDTKTLNLISSIGGFPATSIALQRPKEMAISPDGSMLYLITKNTISIIDTKTLSINGSFDFPNSGSFSLAELVCSPDGNNLYIAEELGKNLYTYNAKDRILNKIFTISTFTNITDLQFSPDGKVLYLGDFKGRTILDGKNNTQIFSFVENRLGNGIAVAGNFTIGQPPLLQTTMPVTNQQLMPNQPFTVTWQTIVQPQSFSIAAHKIEFSTDGGATFNVIPGAEQLKADAQSFIWNVPDIEVSKAQIKVSTVDLGARRAASTTGNFSISKGGSTGDTQAPTVSFNSPLGGEKFNSGDTLQIAWTSSDNVGVTSQDLSLSTDGGSSFPITLASGLSGATQSFMYQIPMSLESEETRLRLVVRDGAGNSAQAITANNFSIVLGADTIPPTIIISEPNQSQPIMAGQPIQVKWQSTDNRAVVSQALLLSFDGGKTFTQIMAFGGSDNSFVLNGLDKLNFTTPQAVVKIMAKDSTGNQGEANALFTISPAVTMASYQAKTLSIIGIGFISNVNNTVKLFVNDKEVTFPPNSVNNSTFIIKGNKKKLNIIKGSNTVKVIVDGVMSNSVSFSF
jgi:hypothetical protein